MESDYNEVFEKNSLEFNRQTLALKKHILAIKVVEIHLSIESSSETNYKDNINKLFQNNIFFNNISRRDHSSRNFSSYQSNNILSIFDLDILQ